MSLKELESGVKPLSRQEKELIKRKSFTGKTDYSKKEDMYNIKGDKISKNECEVLNFANTEYNFQVNDLRSFGTNFIMDREYNNKIKDLNKNVEKIVTNINQNVGLFIDNYIGEKDFVDNYNKYLNQMSGEYQSLVTTLIDQYLKAEHFIKKLLSIHNNNLTNVDAMYHKLACNYVFNHVDCVDMKQKNPITTSKLRYYIKADKKKTDKVIQTDDFKEQDKELNEQETTQPEYEINNQQNIEILKQEKPKYRINNEHNIEILKQTQPKAINEKVNNISLSYQPTKKATKKKDTKFDWSYLKFKQKENKVLFSKQKVYDNKDLGKMQFEWLGDRGWRNPSNLMLSVGKSPFRNYDKSKDVGLKPWQCGKNNNQGWRI